MYNVTVQRLPDDPEVQGVIRAADDSWQLVIDSGGIPHLYVRAKIGDTEPGEPTEGLMCIEDMMPDDLKIRDIMTGEFGGKLSPEDEESAAAELSAERKKTRIPCPR